MLRGWVAQPRLARILQGTESSGICSNFSTVAISSVVWGRLNWNKDWMEVCKANKWEVTDTTLKHTVIHHGDDKLINDATICYRIMLLLDK